MLKQRALPKIRRFARGTSLIEVLIGLLLLSIGLLASAGLHARMVLHARTSQYRAIASHLAHDFAERARANPAAAADGSYDVSGLAAVTASAAAGCSGAATCSAAEIAGVDLAEWRRSAESQLPSAGLFAQRAGTVPVTFDIHVLWVPPGASVTAEEEQLREPCPPAAGAGVNAHCLHLRSAL